ncbi:MAG: DUF1942 domain-containing protein [Mycolicibacterium sp.]|uniref:MPT63 family protein n=1 Tax=Mycolicibacterium sp. TaxID=2320850 RepID=UPI003D0B83CD
MTAVKTAVAGAAIALSATFGAPNAAAEETGLAWLGTQADLVDGSVVQGWTVSHLRPSSDVIPYPVQGQLWEATASDTAIAGDVIPIVSNMNARARDGQTYRALWEVATPAGVNPATLAQGQTTSGKIYFDVTGSVPDSVVYRGAGGPDLAVWVQPPPADGESSSNTWISATPGQAASAVPTGESAEAGQAIPEGDSVGTPLAEAGEQTPTSAAQSQGTGAAGTSEGTPAPQTSEGTPAPQTAQSSAPPSSSDAGQPATAPSDQVVVVAPNADAPASTGSPQG